MNFPKHSVRTVAVIAGLLLLSACGQKGPLTLPETGGTTPIVIRESQASGANAPATPATAPAPASAPANPPSTPPATAPANPTPPQR